MAGPRGYSSYHGRGSKKKILLAVLLVLVILVAVTVILLEKYIVYDESGVPHLTLPPQTEEVVPPQNEDDLNLTIEPAEKGGKITAFTVTETPLTSGGWQTAYAAAASAQDAYNAAAVTMKGGDGTVYFSARTPAAAPFMSTVGDTAAAISALTGEKGVYAIARFSCFHDPRAAMADVAGMGLKNTGGYIFYDGNNSQWLDPGKPAARQYLCALAKELAAMGFDEILLTDVSYPTEGKLDKIDYGETMKTQNLEAFLDEMRTALSEYDVKLSIELPQEVIAQGSDNIAGLTLADIAPRVDRVYAATTAAQRETLAQAVAAAGDKTDFIPELKSGDTAPQGESQLILP